MKTKIITDIVDITEDQLKAIIGKIGRKGFCSEADFQFSLAWELKKNISDDIEIRLEQLFLNKYIDILIIQGNKLLPIELKLKTRKVTITENNNATYMLKTHSAKDTGCYNYLRDIKRLEEIRKEIKNTKEQNFIRGFTIMLTNDVSYLKEPKESNYPSYYNFSIHINRNFKKIIDENGKYKRTNTVKLDWVNKSKDNKNSKWFENSKQYSEPIIIDDYNIQWMLYPNCEEINQEPISNNYNDFYLLINEIKNK